MSYHTHSLSYASYDCQNSSEVYSNPAIRKRKSTSIKGRRTIHASDVVLMGYYEKGVMLQKNKHAIEVKLYNADPFYCIEYIVLYAVSQCY